MDQISKFLRQNSRMVYVFDGKAPLDKKNVVSKRNKKRHRVHNAYNVHNAHNVSPSNLNELKKQIELMDTDQITAYIKQYIEDLKKNPTSNEYVEEVLDFVQAQDGSWDHNIFSPSEQTNDKSNLLIERNKISELKKMFDKIGVPYFVAEGEADDAMVDLCRNGIVDACLSDDMDLLPKGCTNLIQINTNGVTQYILSDILSTLNLSHEQFVDLCILMGSDYYRNFLPRIKPDQIFEIFIKYPSIELFSAHYAENIDKRIADHIAGYCNARKYFIRPPTINISLYNTVNTATINTEAFFMEALNNKLEISDRDKNLIIRNVRAMRNYNYYNYQSHS